ncbi:MAG TPA: WYL domain-containing protein, partial [Frankiaceae bacterium]|nr:WYL domain-containing protein [Frankiaceae bacterium]
GMDPLPPPAGLEPRVEATEAAFAPCLAAVREGRELTFGYRRPGQAQPAPRRVHPWGVVSWRGRWYLVGHDLDREESRVFRLSRMEPGVRAVGPAGVVIRPAGLDLRAAVEAAEPGEPAFEAVIRVRDGAALSLRQGAPTGPEPDTIVLTDRDIGRLADRVVEFAADAQPVDSPELVAEVRRRLKGALAAHSEGSE